MLVEAVHDGEERRRRMRACEVVLRRTVAAREAPGGPPQGGGGRSAAAAPERAETAVLLNYDPRSARGRLAAVLRSRSTEGKPAVRARPYSAEPVKFAVRDSTAIPTGSLPAGVPCAHTRGRRRGEVVVPCRAPLAEVEPFVRRSGAWIERTPRRMEETRRPAAARPAAGRGRAAVLGRRLTRAP